MSRHFAHTLPGRPEEEWQGLLDHLRGVGAGAAARAASFGAEEWARLAGLWHDLGKYSADFQRYLRTAASPDPHVADSATKTDHSTAGAKHAVASFPLLGHLLAYPIAGHHSGLLDGIGEGACLDQRLRKEVEWRDAPPPLLAASEPKLPDFVHSAIGQRAAFTVSFFVRMLFSCLVDADFLDTEAFMRPDRASQRPKWPPDILERMSETLDRSPLVTRPPRGRVDEARARVRCACIDAAMEPPGLFSLTVPTGGGKTLSSLAFALRHAILHGLERVIYVAPFTTIIEQNAEVFRAALGPHAEVVLEHHSNLDEGKETVLSRILSTENWDAPLIVTTSVQLFESLFASRTSRCRKLHRLARSVIILDEAQTIPVDLLAPTLVALRELSHHYGATVVLCTATQPAIHRRDRFEIGLEGVREIIPDARQLYHDLRRVRVQDLGPQADADLVERIAEHSQGLCVVNTRRHARVLFDALKRHPGVFHLSALMCPEHRSEEIIRIRARLAAGEICRLVSTQLIEAGVDIDFPVVYRSLSGLDSLAQAAGRCNRNGRAPVGDVFVFRSEHVRSEVFFRDTTNCAAEILPLFDDPLSLEAIERYFRLYYWSQKQRWDAKQVLTEFHLVNEPALPFQFGFSTASNRYKLIEDTGKPVIVPWRERGTDLCEQLRRDREPDRRILQRLQRFTVRIPTQLWERSLGRSIDLVHERYPVLISPEISYDEQTGLRLDEDSTTFLNV